MSKPSNPRQLWLNVRSDSPRPDHGLTNGWIGDQAVHLLPSAHSQPHPVVRSEPLIGESTAYLTEQIVTYIGNKRAFLGDISSAVEQVKRRLNRSKLRVFDAFSGSGVVSRFLKAHASSLVTNDIEDYATVISHCYLANRSRINQDEVVDTVHDLNKMVDEVSLPRGFIEELYAPASEDNIRSDDRVFYTPENARRLDSYRRLIEDHVERQDWPLYLGPLISKASVHSNTAGVFKGFYKNRHTGIGHFGGTGSDALERIKAPINLVPPVLSRYECDYEVLQGDANQVAGAVPSLDLAYIDPPYNQHPYGSNYFMLNLLVNYERPTELSKVSGIPKHWKRSGYNVRAKSKALFQHLISSLDSKFLLVSFNDEGFISPREMRAMLENLGNVAQVERTYNAFRGSRNFKNRPLHVTETLYLLEKT